MMSSKKFKAKYFQSDMPVLMEDLQKATAKGSFIRLLNDDKHTRIELVKQEENKYFLTINREKWSSIPVKYDEDGMTHIECENSEYLGELYYAIITNDMIVAVSALGSSLKKALNKALYNISHNNNLALSVKPQLDVEMYDKFKHALRIINVDMKLSFNNDLAVKEFLDTPEGSQFEKLLQYDNWSIDFKLNGTKKFPINRDVINLVEAVIRQGYCKKINVKFEDDNGYIIQTNLMAPVHTYNAHIVYDNYLDDSVAYSFLNRALGDVQGYHLV